MQYVNLGKTAIVGATKLRHLDDAISALEVRLSAQEITELESAYLPHPIAGII
jgi:aryl-alcohol dehydrogenase-like predicted oxidoreductase